MKNEDLVKSIVAAVKNCLPEGKETIGLHEPCFEGNEWLYVKECIDSGWVSSVGKFVDIFEQRLAEYTGVKRAIAVVNGTAALHISLKLAGVETDDEVITPALTFIATANAVAYCNAIPHFVDNDIKTLGMDPLKLEAYLRDIAEVRSAGCFNRITGRRIKAAVPMHTFGHPIDLDAMQDVCQRFRLELVEDAAESLGSYYKGRHTGNAGKFAALSFNGNKVITTGGGGAILTNDLELGKLAKHITTTAKLPHKWEFHHDAIGYNYRLPNINAALGCAQLEQLPRFLDRKRLLAERYRKAFDGLSGVDFFVEPEFAQSNYWLNAILLADGSVDTRNECLTQFNKSGVLARPAWKLMYELSMYKDCPKMACQVSENIISRLINIPSSVYLEGLV